MAQSAVQMNHGNDKTLGGCMNHFRHTSKLLLFAMCLGTTTANAGAILTTGLIQMGVKDDGTLGFSGTGLVGPSGDAITPGCLCEGYGVAANGNGNFFSYNNSSTGVSSANFVAGFTADAGTSTTVFANGLSVVQTYSSAAGGVLFRDIVTITNTTGSLMTDVRYARTLDWDVPPGHFSDDFTTVYGGSPSGPAGAVLHTSLNPFADPNPMVTRTLFANTNRVDEPGDLGAYFILSFGNLAAGASTSFNTYIGAAGTTADFLTALNSVGIEAYSYSFDNDGPVTYGWGFQGLGLPPAGGPSPVPEPGAYGLMATGLAAIFILRRRRAALGQ